jgi:3'(2'), 5'-bisphosphate nucleotidase
MEPCNLMQDDLMQDRARIAAIDSDALARIALEAGALIMEVRNRGFDVDRKDDNSPVTEADQKAEKIILEGLAKLAPGIPVLAEEEASAGRIPKLGNLFFCVDPLDGTREFINGNKDFTVNIALVFDKTPIIGVIYAPAHDMLYVASGPDSGWSARVPVGDPLPAPVLREPLRIRSAPARPCAVASRSHRTPETDRFLDAHGITDTKSAGSSLKFCLIATGEADIYPRLGRTMEWDTAAGQAIVQAAGGKVLTLDGTPMLYDKAERGYDNPHFVVYGDFTPH